MNINSAVVWHPVHPIFSIQLGGQSFQKHFKLQTAIGQLLPLSENHGKCSIVVCLACNVAVHLLYLCK